MANSDTWARIHAERHALADDLTGLSDAQWEQPSLCDGWTVHDVLAHMLATAKETPSRFFRGFAAAGFNFDRMAQKDVETARAGGPAATLASYREVADETTK